MSNKLNLYLEFSRDEELLLRIGYEAGMPEVNGHTVKKMLLDAARLNVQRFANAVVTHNHNKTAAQLRSTTEREGKLAKLVIKHTNNTAPTGD